MDSTEPTTAKKRRWGVERRLEFIERRLYWEGKVNRPDLIDFFDISVPQASADIAHYQEVAGITLEYDASARHYVAPVDFQPRLIEPDAQRYLAQLRLVSVGVMPERESWLGWRPTHDIVQPIARTVDAEKLRCILTALRTAQAIHVHYQSLSRPDPLWRWLTPHAIAFEGSRWHMRAWCHTRKNFQDFLIARVLELGKQKPHVVDANQDAEWREHVTMRIGPHPGLSEGARKAIELDYGMEQGELRIMTRVCLSFYLERRLRLDSDAGNVPAERQQIVLLNRDDVEARRRAVAAMNTTEPTNNNAS